MMFIPSPVRPLPLCAAQWDARVLGLRLGRVTNPDGGADCNVPFRPRHDPANQIHEPNAPLYAGNIMMSIYPYQRLKTMSEVAVDERGPLVSPKGRVLDHIGLCTSDLGATLARLKGQGMKVVTRPLTPRRRWLFAPVCWHEVY